MKRRVIILFVFLLSIISSISGVAAQQSFMFSDFTIRGCRTNDGFIPYDTCSRDGLFFCKKTIFNTPYLQDVFRIPGACTGFNPTEPLDDCCPPEYYCNSQDPSANCILRPYECSIYKEQKECEKVGCLWRFDLIPAICVSKNSLQSCSDYNTNSTCLRDLFGLGKTNGIGTDICRGMYAGTKLVLINSCKCLWKGKNETSGNCSLSYNIIDELEQEKIFTCNKLFNSSSCSNGYQNVSWIATNESSPSYFGLTNEELIRFGCQNGDNLIRCGNSYAKLPFFDYRNFIVSILLISILYLFKKVKT